LVFRKLEGPPFKNSAYGDLSYPDGAEVFQGDLDSDEIRELLSQVCATGEFLGSGRRVFLFASNLAPELAPAGAIDELRKIEGLELQWETVLERSRWRRAWNRAFALVGGYAVAGDRGACYLVEQASALASNRLEFMHFRELQIVSLQDRGSEQELFRRAQVEEPFSAEQIERRDPSYALAWTWYDDRSSLYSTSERERPELELTTDFLSGPACSPAIRSAVSRFAAARGPRSFG